MRLIDADTIQYDQLLNTGNKEHPLEWAVSRPVIDAMPTIEAEPTKHGRWLIYNILDYAKRPTGRKVGRCSVCGQLTPEFRLITEEPNWNYCPNCGARMDEVEE